MNSLIVDIAISAEEFERLYQGSAKDVVTHASNGQMVRFPGKILIPYVTHSGICGRFQINFDHRNRFHSVYKL
ncbi:DUF2835 domain-containing protein [Aurantivibrio plasticivorans]